MVRTRPAQAPIPPPNDGVQAGLDELLALRLVAHRVGLRPPRLARREGSGEHPSRFRSRGMDYAESRAYAPGDDIRSMDWRVTARAGRPYTKLYREERERPVFLVVDCGTGMRFGSRNAFKSVVAVRAAALLAWASEGRGDRVGALVVGPAGHREFEPRRGRNAVLGVIKGLAAATAPPAAAQAARPRGDAGGGLGAALGRACRVARPGSLVVVLSDFAQVDDVETEGALERHLAQLRRHNEVVAVRVHDPLETGPPPAGRYAVTDGAARHLLDTASDAVRDAYRAHFERRRQRMLDLCTRKLLALVEVSTADDLLGVLRRALSGR